MAAKLPKFNTIKEQQDYFKANGLNSRGDRRGMSARSQINLKGIINSNTIKTEGHTLKGVIDQVYNISGANVKKSLVGMAQKVKAPTDFIKQIADMPEQILERLYQDNKFIFESFWEYPLEKGDNRANDVDNISELLRAVRR